MMKVIQSAYIEQNDCENAFQEFLFSYRVTPHSSTQIPPADLMYSRRIRYFLPDISNEINSKPMQRTLQQNDSLAKQKLLDNTTGKRRPKESSLTLLIEFNVQTVPIPHYRLERYHVNRKIHVNQP